MRLSCPIRALTPIDGLPTYPTRRGGFLLLDDVTEAWPPVEAAAAFWNASRVGYGYDHCTKAQFYYPSPRKRMRCWRKVEESSHEPLWKGAPTVHNAQREVREDGSPQRVTQRPPPPPFPFAFAAAHPRWAAASVAREERARAAHATPHATAHTAVLATLRDTPHTGPHATPLQRKQLKGAMKEPPTKEGATPPLPPPPLLTSTSPPSPPSPPRPPTSQASRPALPLTPPPAALTMRSMFKAFMSAPSLAETPVLGT